MGFFIFVNYGPVVKFLCDVLATSDAGMIGTKEGGPIPWAAP